MKMRLTILYTILMGLTLLIPPYSSAQDHSDPHEQEQGSFKPVAYERTATIQIDGTIKEVFSLFEPKNRNHLSDENGTQAFFTGSGETKPGEMFMAKHDYHEETWRVVANYDPEDYTISYVYFAPPTELLYREYRRKTNPEGGTSVTIFWRVVGLSNEGNKAVRNYFESGDYEKQIRESEKKYNKIMAEKKKNDSH